MSALEVDTASARYVQPVVAVAHREQIFASGVHARETEGQLDRFRARVHQEDRVEALRKERGQLLGERDDRRVVEPGVGVEGAPLVGDGTRHPRVTVPEHRDVVDHVEEHPAVVGDQVMLPPSLDARRSRVVVLLHVCQHGLATRHEVSPAVVGSRRLRVPEPERSSGVEEVRHPPRGVRGKNEGGHV